MKLTSTSPGNNYKTIGEVNISSDAEIHEKVEKANSAKKAWKELGLEGRIKLLRKVIIKLTEKKEELA